MATGKRRIGQYALVAGACLAAIVIGLRYGRGAGSGAPSAAKPSAMAGAAGQGQQPDVSKMVEALEARLKDEPNNADGWRMLGWAYFNTSRFADAARAYARQTALAPQDGDAWSALGESLVYVGKGGVTDDAAHAFQRAVEIQPKDARARYFLAVRQDLGGDHKGAVEAWIGLLRDAPAGAPYAQSVRELIETVATREKIDIAGRLPAVKAPMSATDAIPGPDAAQMADAARMSPTEQNAMAQGMVDRLAARLADNPKDEEGWQRLMRARMVLGDKAGASKALQQARQTFTGDTATLGRIDGAAKALGVK